MVANTEKTMEPPVPAPDSDAAIREQAATALNATAMSWGEKYKGGVYHFTRNWLLNYFVNFFIGASTAFAFDTTAIGKAYRNWSKEKTDKIQTPILKETTSFLLNFMSRTQLLLCGGHVLQPVLKAMKDNRRRLEFRIGHWLDSLQETFGFGNAASRKSIEEFHRVSSLISIGNHNRKERDSIDVPVLSDEDKALLKKHNVNAETLRFNERKQNWGHVIKARLTGVLFTTLTSVGLTISSQSFVPKFLRFRETWETPLGIKFGNNVVARIPIISSMFKKAEPVADRYYLDPKLNQFRGLNGHELIGEYFIDDLIFTAMSKLGFDKMEKRIDAALDKEEDERARKYAEHMSTPSGDSLLEKSYPRRTTGQDPRTPRTYTAADAPKSFSARRQEEISAPTVQTVA